MAERAKRAPGRQVQPGVNDLATRCPEAAALWDSERNGALEPTQVAAASKRRVWWRCEKGHSWQAAVYSLTLRGSRCPVCAGRQAAAGETDLASRCPELAALWDAERNAAGPETVTPGSHRRVWWRCEKGHSWQAMVFSVAAGRRCPLCARPGPKGAKKNEKRKGQYDEKVYGTGALGA